MTFPLLEPKRIVFPIHNMVEWSDGNFRTADQPRSIETWVSHDLRDLAPMVHGFVSYFDFTMEEIRSLMRDVANGARAEELACSWLQANENVWRQ
eukprot:CAMPEP_0114652868 /NCGR_PEP_ID=MMETSP0191-20121206/9340_1 /TAXON_ID=126664 /ORGANISM="Sorites sp." /LENGTH=94 /DNA_ID=CAMNT_0001867645 /DNA_START=355 /DNA_END=639 /DNA_ORIENTATION=+